MNNKQVRVIIVDDHPVVLQGFSFIFQEIPDIELVEKFTDADAALKFIRKQKIDIVLLDINLQGRNGIDVCAEIQKTDRSCKVIAISNINEYSIIKRMLQAGASGYLLKNASSDEVISAIQKVVAGETGLSRSIRNILDQSETGDIPIITRREKEVLHLLAEGLNSKEIGDKIFISPLTVESHRRNLLQKFKVTNVASLIRKAMEMKYI